MMATKERCFAPLVNLSLEELVPADHFYRRLERTLDLSFVREFVQETYAGSGRPSVDPVVFFKLQLVKFFESIRSERLLMHHADDRLSVRWYVGYDLNEPLPDHSSLTRIRTRYGVEVFRRFFERIVEQCQAAGLVWGKELYFNDTKVAANAGKESLKPRFFVEAHLNELFGEVREETAEGAEQEIPQEERAGIDASEQEERPAPVPLPASPSQQAHEELSQRNAAHHDWIKQLGVQDWKTTSREYQRVADLQVSTTDPDATLMLQKPIAPKQELVKPQPASKPESFILTRTLTGHSDTVYSVAISRDGLTLARGSLDRMIKLWNPYTGKLFYTFTGMPMQLIL